MTDWNSDPEMKALRLDFIRSLEPRLQFLRNALRTRRLDGVLSHAHKLAGTAESYGFAELTRVAGILEDLLEEGVRDPWPALKNLTAALEETLK